MTLGLLGGVLGVHLLRGIHAKWLLVHPIVLGLVVRARLEVQGCGWGREDVGTCVGRGGARRRLQ